MKSLIVIFVGLLLMVNCIKAEPKKQLLHDTSKLQQQKARDTAKNKTPLNLQNSKIETADSADLKLTKKAAGKTDAIDTADFKIKYCDFEKDANAMVLLDKAVMVCGFQNILLVRHKRVKIFNQHGESEANIRIEYDDKYGAESILGVEAATANFENGKIVYTRLDPKLIYSENTGAGKNAAVFSMPNVKSGSIIDYLYIWKKSSSRKFPDWSFQSALPTRYSEINFFINRQVLFSALTRTRQPFVKDTGLVDGPGHVWALANIPSAKDEPFMRSENDVMQGISLLVSAVQIAGERKDVEKDWSSVGEEFAADKSFINPLNQKLNDEDTLINKANALKTQDEKIAFLFNQVKTRMKWNEEKYFYSKDGIKSAWKKKSGNWGEINMVLCHLLKQSGITSYPLLVSTRNNGNIVPAFVNVFQLNKLVVYVPVDSTKYYVMDATDKYGIYNEIPYDLLNSYGLCVSKENKKHELIFLRKNTLVSQVVSVNAEIKPNGTMNGTAQVYSYSYNKSQCLELYKLLDEKKYKEYLGNNNNGLKISELKLENSEIDSLPLKQNIIFSMDLPGADEKYILFNPNLFSSLHSNPFINENRVSDIDFGYLSNNIIKGRYKIPEGYKIDALPKSVNVLMPDKSIGFTRVVAEDGGYIIINYAITHGKTVYSNTEYPDVYAYYKKMNEFLNEQIVLKKR